MLYINWRAEEIEREEENIVNHGENTPVHLHLVCPLPIIND